MPKGMLFRQTDFTGGEVSRRYIGRTDAQLYYKSLQIMKNMYGLPSGNAIKRTGFVSRGRLDLTNKPIKCKIFPFLTNNDKDYLVVLFTYLDGNNAILQLNVINVSGSISYELSEKLKTVYHDKIDILNRIIDGFNYTQSGNTMILTCKAIEVNQIWYDLPIYLLKKTTITDRFSISKLSHDSFPGKNFFPPMGDFNYARSSKECVEIIGDVAVDAEVTLKFPAFSENALYIHQSYAALYQDPDTQGNPMKAALFYMTEWRSLTEGKFRVISVDSKWDNKLKSIPTWQMAAISRNDAFDDDDVYDDDAAGFPHCVGFFEDRLYFANTNINPNMIWFSRVGDYFNFRLGINDSDGIATRLIAGDQGRQIDEIIWAMALKRLYVGSSGGEWWINGGNSTSDAFTPATVIRRKESSYGSSGTINPNCIADSVIYVQRNNKKIREYAYSSTLTSEGSDSVELTMLQDHWFDKDVITDTDYQQMNDSIIWVLTKSGKLYGLGYIPDQKMLAGFQVEYKSARIVDVCVNPGRTTDKLFVAVEHGGMIILEELSDRLINPVYADAFTYCVVSKEHKVSLLDDYYKEKLLWFFDKNALPVGKYTIDKDWKVDERLPSDSYFVGFPYEALIQTNPISNPQAATETQRKKITRLAVRTYESSPFEYSCDGVHWDEIENMQPMQNMDEQPMITADMLKVDFDGFYDDSPSIYIRNTSPTAFTLLSVAAEVNI